MKEREEDTEWMAAALSMRLSKRAFLSEGGKLGLVITAGGLLYGLGQLVNMYATARREASQVDPKDYNQTFEAVKQREDKFRRKGSIAMIVSVLAGIGLSVKSEVTRK